MSNEPWEERINDNCIILHHPTSVNVLFVFCAVDIPPGQIPGGTRMFRTDRIDANIVILNDPQKVWYLGGIEGLGNDLESTLERIEKIHKSLLGLGGVSIAYGNSMGAFGAVYYGCLLNLDVVLGPGCELLVGNPVGYAYRRVKGKYRRPDIRNVMLCSRTFCHLVVGEEFLGDVIGCFRVLDLPNVYVQSVKNYGHGVTAYLAIYFDVRRIINNYISIFSKRGFAESFRREFKKNMHYDQLSDYYFPQAIVAKRDMGSLLQNKRIATYLYSTDIMMSSNAFLYERRVKVLTILANQEKDNIIKSYLLFRIAKIYFTKLGNSERAIEAAKAAYILNDASRSIPQFISTYYFNTQQYEECCFWSQEAIANRKGLNIANIFAPSDCYIEYVESLRHLGCLKLALMQADNYIAMRNMVRLDELKKFVEAYKEDSKKNG